jgi:hypothetical protein
LLIYRNLFIAYQAVFVERHYSIVVFALGNLYSWMFQEIKAEKATEQGRKALPLRAGLLQRYLSIEQGRC